MELEYQFSQNVTHFRQGTQANACSLPKRFVQRRNGGGFKQAHNCPRFLQYQISVLSSLSFIFFGKSPFTPILFTFLKLISRCSEHYSPSFSHMPTVLLNARNVICSLDQIFLHCNPSSAARIAYTVETVETEP